MNTFFECSLTEITAISPLRTFSVFTVSEIVSLVMDVFEETNKKGRVGEYQHHGGKSVELDLAFGQKKKGNPVTFCWKDVI